MAGTISTPYEIVDISGTLLSITFDNWALYDKDPRISPGDTAATVLDSGSSFSITSGTGQVSTSVASATTGTFCAWNNNWDNNVQFSVTVA